MRLSKYSNLTIKERKATEELESRNIIVITDAKKGGAVVIQEDYVKEAESQLNTILLLLTLKLSAKLNQNFKKKTY